MMYLYFWEYDNYKDHSETRYEDVFAYVILNQSDVKVGVRWEPMDLAFCV